MIAHATPLDNYFVTITFGKQVEYQCEAGYHVELERKSGSKPEGCHAKERADPEQPVQAPEEAVIAVSSCGHVDLLEERFASWNGQQDRPFPSQSSSARSSDLRDITDGLKWRLCKVAQQLQIPLIFVCGDGSSLH